MTADNTTHDFVVIVGEKDDERFRRFRTGYDWDVMQSIASIRDAVNIWALNTAMDNDARSHIVPGDRVFFAERGLEFTHCGTVSKILEDVSIAIRLWGDSPRMRQHSQLVLFSSINEISESFSKICNDAGIDPSNASYGIHMAQNKIKLATSEETQFPGISISVNNGPPGKKSEVVTRFIRDNKKVMELKSVYGNACQICDTSIKLPSESSYSEVHHLHPLGEHGDDDFDNMLVLCPNHHVEFDYRAIGIMKDKKTIISSTGGVVGQIHMKKNHQLATKNIEYHLSRMQKT